jgi:hypothetical protein
MRANQPEIDLLLFDEPVRKMLTRMMHESTETLPRLHH